METHLWVYLGSHFQKDLTEEGRLTLNVGSTILRAEEVPRLNTREKELSTSLLSVSWIQIWRRHQPCLTHHSRLHPHTVNHIDPPSLTLFLSMLLLQHRATWRPWDWVHRGCSLCVLAPPFDSHFCMRKHWPVKARTSKRVLAMIRKRGHPKKKGVQTAWLLAGL